MLHATARESDPVGSLVSENRMTRRPRVLILSLIAGSLVGARAPAPAAPYLGERPPGPTPRVFAPGVVSTGNLHGRLAISPDGRELYWSTADTTTWTTQLVGTREVDGRWTAPESPPFAKGAVAQSPMFSPDGRRLYYQVLEGQRWTTVCVERLGSGWSAPRREGPMLNCGASFTRSGRIYFPSRLETKVWGSGIFSGTLGPDGVTGTVALDSTINVPGAIDYAPHVAPDESFLLFASNRPLIGEREDLHVHVSFRAADGSWSAPRRVSDLPARFPSLSPDGRYLFLCGDDGNAYWMETKAIDRLRPGRGAGDGRR
jgi:hypothetical protein